MLGSAAELDSAFLNAVATAMAVVPVPRNLADSAVDEIKSVLLNGTRLYGFSHRPCLSVRHPRMRYIANGAAAYESYLKKKRQEEEERAERRKKQLSAASSKGYGGKGKAAGAGKGLGLGMAKSEVELNSADSETSSPPPLVDLLSSVDCFFASIDGPSTLVEEAHTWLDIGTYYDALLEVICDVGGALYGSRAPKREDGRGDCGDEDSDADSLFLDDDDDEFGTSANNFPLAASGVEGPSCATSREHVRKLIDKCLLHPNNGWSSGTTASVSSPLLGPLGGSMGVAISVGNGRLRTPLEVCRYRIEKDVGIDTVIRRFWVVFSRGSQGPPIARSTDQKNAPRAHVPRSGGGEQTTMNGCTEREQYGGSVKGFLPPAAYITLMTRLVSVVYHKDALMDLLDFIVGDLLWDGANLPSASVEEREYEQSLQASREGNAEGSGDDGGDGQSGSKEDEEREGDAKTLRGYSYAERVAQSLADTVYGVHHAQYGSRSTSASGGGGGLLSMAVETLPSLTYNQFKLSLLELADNWTATVHPHEWTALLWDWYDKVVRTNEGAQQSAASAVLRTNRARKATEREEDVAVGRRVSAPQLQRSVSQASQNRTQTNELMRISPRPPSTPLPLLPNAFATLASEESEVVDDQHRLGESERRNDVGGAYSYSRWVSEWRKAAEEADQPENEMNKTRSDDDERERNAKTSPKNRIGAPSPLPVFPSPKSARSPQSSPPPVASAAVKGARGHTVSSIAKVVGSPHSASPVRFGAMRLGHDGVAIAPRLDDDQADERGVAAKGNAHRNDRSTHNSSSLSPNKKGSRSNVIVYSVLDWHRQQMQWASKEDSTHRVHVGSEGKAEKGQGSDQTLAVRGRGDAHSTAPHQLISNAEKNTVSRSVHGESSKDDPHKDPSASFDSGDGRPFTPVDQGQALANAFRCAPIYLFELTTNNTTAPSAAESQRGGPRDKARTACKSVAGEDTEKAHQSARPKKRSLSYVNLNNNINGFYSPNRRKGSINAALRLHQRQYFRGMLKPLVLGQGLNTQRLVGPNGEDFSSGVVGDEESANYDAE